MSKKLTKNQCSKCGCECNNCSNEDSIYLYQEIETLKESLKERDERICNLDSQILNHAIEHPNGEIQSIKDNLLHWQDKYERLLENYRRLQKVNQSLEDKLLKVADRFSSEKVGLNQIISDLSVKLTQIEMEFDDHKKQNEIEQKNYLLMIQKLQQQNAHNINSLSINFQNQSLENGMKRDEDLRNGNAYDETFKVPIMTFPPTAIMYSFNGNHQNMKFRKQNEIINENYKSTTTSAAVSHSNECNDTMII